MADGFVVRVTAVLVLLAVVSLIWWLITRRRGTLRPAPVAAAASGRPPVRLADLGVEVPGPRLSLVQFSSPHCAPCRRSSRLWRELAEDDPEVAFTEVQAEDHLSLLGRLGVLTIPSTALFDSCGALTGLITGPPQKAQLAELSATRGAQTVAATQTARAAPVEVIVELASPAEHLSTPALSQGQR